MSACQADLARPYGIAVPYLEDLVIPPPELFPKRPARVIREEDGLECPFEDAIATADTLIYKHNLISAQTVFSESGSSPLLSSALSAAT